LCFLFPSRLLSLFVLLQYNVIGRVRDLDLLQKTIDSGLLSKLDAQGLDLATIEKLLPLADKLGVLSLAANNQQLLINGVAPLLVEGAPLLIPVLSGAVGAGPGAFFLAAGAFGGLEAFFIINEVDIPLVGLSAGVFGGLLLVPLTLISAAAGAALGSLKK
jgi:Protein of unknown function (DUF1118)